MKVFRKRWNKRVQKTKHHLGNFEDISYLFSFENENNKKRVWETLQYEFVLK